MALYEVAEEKVFTLDGVEHQAGEELELDASAQSTKDGLDAGVLIAIEE